MADCCNSCGQCSKCLGTPVKAIWDYMEPLFNMGEPLAGLRAKNMPFVETVGFDVVHTTLPDGSVFKKLVAKSERADGSMSVYTNEDCKVVWYENCTLDLFKTTVAVDATGATSITLTDVKQLLGANTGSTIQVETPAGLKTVTIATVNDVTNVVTLKAGQTITVVAGACVERVGYETELDCDTAVNNRVTLPTSRKQYTAPFKFFPILHEFKLCDLNLRVMGGKDSIQKKLDAMRQLGEELIYNSIYNAVYFDDQAVAGNLRGLFPELKRFAATCGKPTSYDFANCCDPLDECESMEKQINMLLNIVRTVTASGAYTDRNITIEVNEKQWILLTAVQKFFFDSRGISQVDMDGKNTIQYVIPSLSYAGYTVDFKYNPFFDKFKVPFMMVRPTDALQIETKAIVGLNDFKLQERGNESIMSGDTPMIRYIDRTDIEGDGFGQCIKIKGGIELAAVWRHIDSCAYFYATNFGACAYKDCGDLCANTGAVTNLIA